MDTGEQDKNTGDNKMNEEEFKDLAVRFVSQNKDNPPPEEAINTFRQILDIVFDSTKTDND